MTLTASQQLELEKPVTRFVYFVAFYFVSGTAYVCTAGQTITWGGHDWLGLGSVGSISQVEEAAGAASSALNFGLNIAQPSWLAESIGAVEDYRGQPAKMYMCPLDEQFRMVDTPQICWRGIMDTVVVGVNAEVGQAVMKCETSAYGVKMRRSSLRLNAAQQKQKHPTDTGFDYLTNLIAFPQMWLSKKFQQI
jgi:hypothetical protein